MRSSGEVLKTLGLTGTVLALFWVLPLRFHPVRGAAVAAFFQGHLSGASVVGTVIHAGPMQV